MRLSPMEPAVIYQADTTALRHHLAKMRTSHEAPSVIVELIASIADDAARAWAELHRPEGVP